jgi:hypothetical protein
MAQELSTTKAFARILSAGFRFALSGYKHSEESQLGFWGETPLEIGIEVGQLGDHYIIAPSVSRVGLSIQHRVQKESPYSLACHSTLNETGPINYLLSDDTRVKIFRSKRTLNDKLTGSIVLPQSQLMTIQESLNESRGNTIYETALHELEQALRPQQ